MVLQIEFSNLHEMLRTLYDEMLPLSAEMAAVAKGLAGLGALFYVALKVWQALSRAEPIDMFPLLRPFALGLCIMFFPTMVLGTMNAVLSPVVTGTHGILEGQVLDLNALQAQKDQLEHEAMLRNPETAYLVSDEEFDRQLEELGWSPSDLATMSGMYLERGMYQLKQDIRNAFRELLEILFQAAALVIDTIRTFFLIVLSILGQSHSLFPSGTASSPRCTNGSRVTSACTCGFPFRICSAPCWLRYNPSYWSGTSSSFQTPPLYRTPPMRCTSFL